MKKTGIVVAAFLIILVLVGGFYYTVKHTKVPSADEKTLTEVEKINTKDLSKEYPSTPREVVKFYNRILTAYYAEKLSDEELAVMMKQAHTLFDTELQILNPLDSYSSSVKSEINEYKSASRVISSSEVCDSSDVLYQTDTEKNDELAYVKASYFIKEGSDFKRTHEMYVLRQDTSGKWRILGYYQIEATENASGK